MRPLAIRVTVVSAGMTLVIGLCLFTANTLLHGDKAQVSVLGRSINMGSPGLVIGVALVGITLWAMLGSLSRLLVARQVRNYLRGRTAGEDVEARADDDSGGASLMGERLLLESFLGQWSLATRLSVLAVLLVWVLPWLPSLGLVVLAVTLAVILRRRRAAGMRVYRQYRAAARTARQGISDDMIDAIYAREVVVQRLPAGEVLLLALPTLGLVLAPVWVLNRSSVALTSVWVLLLLQSVLSLATGAATLGWRQEAFFGPPLHEPIVTEGPPGAPVADVRKRPVLGTVIITEPPHWWPRGDAVVMRRDSRTPMLVVPSGDQKFSGVDLSLLAGMLDDSGMGLVTIDPDRMDHGLDVLRTIPNLLVRAVVLPPTHDGRVDLMRSWPTASVVDLPRENSVDLHLNAGIPVPELTSWLGPARTIVAEALWVDDPHPAAALQVHERGQPRSSCIAVLDSHRQPPASLRALAAICAPGTQFISVCDLSGARFRDGVRTWGASTEEAAVALAARLEDLPDVELVLGTRRGAAMATALASAVRAQRLVLLNPEGSVPAREVPIACSVHVSGRVARRVEQAHLWARSHDVVNHDTGAVDLVSWLLRRGLMAPLLSPPMVAEGRHGRQ